MPFKMILAGFAVFLISLAKIHQHVAAFDPFAASWCRTPGTGAGLVTQAADGLMLGHCWGCYGAVLGLAIMALPLAGRWRRGGFAGQPRL